MPQYTPSIATYPSGKDQGRMTGKYMTASGRAYNATVLAAGGSSGFKIRLYIGGGGSRTIDNVAVATTVNEEVGKISFRR
jgi:hypothetical protein